MVIKPLFAIWVLNQKIGGKKTKMDGENNGSKPYEQNGMIWGGFHPYFWFNTHMFRRF